MIRPIMSLILTLIAAFGCNSIFADTAIESAGVLNHPYFFEIKNNGQTSYILGTDHFDVFDGLPDYVMMALKNRLVFMSESFLEDEREDNVKSGGTDFTKGQPLNQEAISRLKMRGIPDNLIE